MKLSWFRRFGMGFWTWACPHFWKEYPKIDKAGPWHLEVWRTNPFGERLVWEETVQCGFQEAYIKVRRKALWADNHTPYADGCLGIDWRMRRPDGWVEPKREPYQHEMIGGYPGDGENRLA